ncbi:hypothetical protein [Paludisphaera sp.]|uniref:hypothetical protein n=1 Tax=Paludisphaera sp. TaxID=2017432 RepID=UPI00301D0E05
MAEVILALGRAARWAAVAIASALTMLAVGLPIAMTGAHGGEPGTLPVPRNPLAYFALLLLVPEVSSTAVAIALAWRLRLLHYSPMMLNMLTFIQVANTMLILSYLVRLAAVLPS